jgi:hypothetical protein
MADRPGWRRVTATTRRPRVGDAVGWRSSLFMPSGRPKVYRPVSDKVSRIGNLRALHSAVRLLSRGRTLPLSQ